MAVEDRNVARTARHARRNYGITPPAASEIDVDAPILVLSPTFNFAIAELSAHALVVATANAIARVSVTPPLSAMGNVDAAALSVAADLATVAYGAFYQNVAGVPTLRATGTAVLPAFTIAALKWGSVLLQVDAAGTVTAKPADLHNMAYASRKVALGVTPQPDAGNGVVGMLQIQAGAVDFVGATGLLDTGTNDVQDEGRSYLGVTLPVLTTAQGLNSEEQDDATRFIDGTGLRKGFGQAGDLFAVTLRGVGGASAITTGAINAKLRPFPVQGEGVQNGTGSVTS